MFVKLLSNDNLPVILNINHITCMRIKPLKFEVDDVVETKIKKISEADYEIRLQDGSVVYVEYDQYEQLCDILTKKI